MTKYEILKRTKIIYEYLNDLLNNGDFEINNEYMSYVNKTMDVIKDMYENTYHLMYVNKEEHNFLNTDLQCPCCEEKVLISDLINYAYVCDRCDENYYLCEGNLNHEWYFEDDKDEKLNEDFNLELSYDAKNNNIIIGTESSSGVQYECQNIADLKNVIASYVCNYINYENRETYSIKIWETEELRNQGLSFEYLETYYSKENAIDDAQRIMDRFGYAYLEVIKDSDNSVVFGTDGKEENYYNEEKYQNRIYKVSRDELNKYINDWSDKQLAKDSYDLLYCKDTDYNYIAIDNTSGDCYVEEFETESQAVFWLDADMLAEEIPYSIIPKRVLECVIDTTKSRENDYEKM